MFVSSLRENNNGSGKHVSDWLQEKIISDVVQTVIIQNYMYICDGMYYTIL